MFSQKSLRTRFIIQLASASTMLIVIFSVMLYNYIKITIFESSVQAMLQEATKISAINDLDDEKLHLYFPEISRIYHIKFEQSDTISKPKFIKSHDTNSTFLTLLYPYRGSTNLNLQVNVTIYEEIVNQILIDIILVNAVMVFLIIFYAMFLSRTLLMPVKTISNRLSKLNEKFLRPIADDKIPDEFHPLWASINSLIERIQTFVLYQKELFIGAAHELKTPLAVMKTKNEVTLLKPREADRYIEALKGNNESINNMNKMISSILEIGRQEGAQFEEPENRDVIAYLNELCVNFTILARTEKKDLKTELKPTSLMLWIQSNLFLHVMQNFAQNAIKFTEEGGVVWVKSRVESEKFIVEITNFGASIDENIDYFAPFKRYGNKPGAGLGLFLAKNAAQAMGAYVKLENTPDKDGVVARFTLPMQNKI